MNEQILSWLAQGGLTAVASAVSAWGAMKATQRAQGIEIRDLKQAVESLRSEKAMQTEIDRVNHEVDELKTAVSGIKEGLAGMAANLEWIKTTLARMESSGGRRREIGHGTDRD